VYFVDRLKRMVKISGYDVYPSRIETIIGSLEYIDNVCVVLSDESRLKAYVVPKEASSEKHLEKEIRNICKKNLSRWSHPQEIIFVSEIPQTLLNKNHYRGLS
jgi:long-chain acyl-CoA synthetase